MTWTPHSLEQVENILRSEESELSADERTKFARVKVPIRKVLCIRNVQYPNDSLFVVADDGAMAVVFDDVDEEFAFCESAHLGGAVRQWTLAGSLSAALGKLS